MVQREQKVDQETEQKDNEEPNRADMCHRSAVAYGLYMTGTAPSTSDIFAMARKEKFGYDQLPKEMHEMKFGDEKVNKHEEKVSLYIMDVKMQ